MSEPEDLEARVADLEGEVADLNSRVRRSEQDAAAARVLAGGADRDVADLGAEVREFRGEFLAYRDQNNRLHSATREDLTDLRGRMESGFGRVDANFARVDANFARVDANFARVDANFAQAEASFARVDANFLGIRGRLDATAAGQQQIVELLTTLMGQQTIRPTLELDEAGHPAQSV